MLRPNQFPTYGLQQFPPYSLQPFPSSSHQQHAFGYDESKESNNFVALMSLPESVRVPTTTEFNNSPDLERGKSKKRGL